MIDSPRNGKPYTWVTWITGLLSGMDACEWRAWYRSHYRYAKLPREGGDIESWRVEHDQMTTARVDTLKSSGWRVHVEEANAFKLLGKSATLAGKPDIVAFHDATLRAVVIDEKSGSPKPSDEWQVLVYMFALPITGSVYGDISGQIEYRGSCVDIPISRLDETARNRIAATMRMIGDMAAPSRTPSQGECAYCDIAACPERIDTSASMAETDVF
jgi:CRISPR/Cas system-associated exonuclease Cas4 (RecB family)